MSASHFLTFPLSHLPTFNPRPPKTRHHFIRDEQRTVCAGEVGGLAQPVERLRDHSGRALHQWLEDEGSVRFAALLLFRQRLIHFAHAFPIAPPIVAGVFALGIGAVERATVAVGRHHAVGLEEQLRVSAMEEIDLAEADRADRVAMIGAGEGEEAWFGLRSACASSELVAELEGDFERGGAVVAVENFGEGAGEKRSRGADLPAPLPLFPFSPPLNDRS